MSLTACHLVRAYEHAVARMVLCCVHEVPFPLGIKKTIGILRGSKATFVIEHRLHELEMYGAFTTFSTDYLRHVIEMLVARELVSIATISKYDYLPVLKLTEGGHTFLIGQATVDIPFVEQLCDREVIEFTEDEQQLYDHLKKARRQLADAKDLPAYTICHDTVLRELVRQKPATLDGLLIVRGIGDRFVESYGQVFLGILQTQ